MRSAALGTYLGGVVLLFVIVAAALVFSRVTDRSAIPDDAREDPSAIGTTGEPRSDTLPGGFDPGPTHGSTRSELEYRGAGEPSQGPMPGLSAGGRVELRGVEVEGVDGDTIWIRDRGNRAAVIAPAGTSVRAGQRVDISGSIEGEGDRVRIRATRVVVR